MDTPSLRFHDTLTGETRPLSPRVRGEVSIYACGPTVYDSPHLGHARTALTYDVLRRFLRWVGYRVILVRNITDIDDNIINRAAEEGTTEPELAARFTKVYVDEMRAFGIEDPDHGPHATQYVDKMIAVIQELEAKGVAYQTGNGVYFSVDAYPDYGRLVHRTAPELRESAGARVEVDTDKRDPLDFVLWKAAKEGEPTWESPWGPGRPGWHIECVSMALDILGENFDIHGGGTDLAFPHHENERAECEAAGHDFAAHWIHSAMLNIGGEKMSKSLGNFETLGGALESFGPAALRLAFLQAHYRSVVELGDEAMAGAAGGVDRLEAYFRRVRGLGITSDDRRDDRAMDRFRRAMADDLGTPEGVATIFDLVSEGNNAIDSDDLDRAAVVAGTAAELIGVLGLPLQLEAESDQDIDALVAERTAARAAKDFARADEIRDELKAAGIEIEDTASGTTWHRR